MARFTDLDRNQWRKDADRVVWRRVSARIQERYGSFKIADLQEQMKKHGLEDAEFSIDSEVRYGDEEAWLEMTGWRVASTLEVKQALDELDARKREHEAILWAREQQALNEMRKKHPELFK